MPLKTRIDFFLTRIATNYSRIGSRNAYSELTRMRECGNALLWEYGNVEIE